MICSRREFAFLFPALAGTQAKTPTEMMASKAFRFEDLPMRESGPIRLYQIFTGVTHSGFLLDLHESELAAGQAPHKPHGHVHEELILIREGMLEFTISGQKTVLGPGSVAYIASSSDHGFRNIGTTTAKYFVLALGQDSK